MPGFPLTRTPNHNHLKVIAHAPFAFNNTNDLTTYTFTVPTAPVASGNRRKVLLIFRVATAAVAVINTLSVTIGNSACTLLKAFTPGLTSSIQAWMGDVLPSDAFNPTLTLTFDQTANFLVGMLLVVEEVESYTLVDSQIISVTSGANTNLPIVTKSGGIVLGLVNMGTITGGAAAWGNGMSDLGTFLLVGNFFIDFGCGSFDSGGRQVPFFTCPTAAGSIAYLVSIR